LHFSDDSALLGGRTSKLTGGKAIELVRIPDGMLHESRRCRGVF